MAHHVYSFFKSPEGIYRPWIPINIINPSNNIVLTIMALLDTGADKCVFPKFVAEQLGITLKETTETEVMQGLGEVKIPVWKHPFKVQLLSNDRKQVCWKGKEGLIGCVEHDNIPPILGFSDFMCHFKITFNYTSRKIILDDRPSV